MHPFDKFNDCNEVDIDEVHQSIEKLIKIMNKTLIDKHESKHLDIGDSNFNFEELPTDIVSINIKNANAKKTQNRLQKKSFELEPIIIEDGEIENFECNPNITDSEHLKRLAIEVFLDMNSDELDDFPPNNFSKTTNFGNKLSK